MRGTDAGLIRVALAVAVRSAVTVTVIALVVLTGCSKEQDAIQQPAQPARETPEHRDESAERELAETSYREFVEVLSQADSLPDATRKHHLSKYMIDPQLSHVLKIVKQHKADNIGTYGSTIVRVRDVDIQDGHAVVRDCQDATKTGLRNTMTDKKINRGVASRHIEATLSKGPDGRWRVSEYNLLKGGC